MYKFTEEDEINIHRTIKEIDEDLHNLLKSYGISELKVPIDYNKKESELDYSFHMFEHKWLLHVTNKDIWIRSRKSNSNWLRIADENGIFTAFEVSYLPTLFVFSNFYYNRNRALVLKELKRQLKIKEKFSSTIDSNLEKAKKIKSATIEIDLPSSINQHSIEVFKENGRNIGIIDFGGRTVKIITDGDFVLVPREELSSDNKVKRKI